MIPCDHLGMGKPYILTFLSYLPSISGTKGRKVGCERGCDSKGVWHFGNSWGSDKGQGEPDISWWGSSRTCGHFTRSRRESREDDGSSRQAIAFVTPTIPGTTLEALKHETRGEHAPYVFWISSGARCPTERIPESGVPFLYDRLGPTTSLVVPELFPSNGPFKSPQPRLIQSNSFRRFWRHCRTGVLLSKSFPCWRTSCRIMVHKLSIRVGRLCV